MLPGMGRYLLEAVQARDYPVDPGDQPAVCDGDRRDEPGRRPAVRLARPAGAVHVMSVQPAALEPLAPAATRPSGRPRSAAACRRCRRWHASCGSKPLGAFGAALIVLFLVLAIGAQWLAPYPYDVGAAADRLQGPSLAHPFGTDANGRDLLSRIIWGARISVTIGFGAVLLSTVVAVVVGVTSGLLRRLGRPAGAARGRHLDLVPGAGAAGQPGGDSRAGPVEHDAGAGDPAGAGHGARRAQRGAGHARPAVRRVGALRRGGPRAHRAQLRAAQRLGGDPGAGDDAARRGRPGGVDAQLSGLWCAAAVSDLGRDAERHRPRVHAPVAVAVDLARAGDQRRGVRLQHARRRAARRARPAVARADSTVPRRIRCGSELFS